MLSLDDAIATVLREATRPTPEVMRLENTLGLVLAGDLVAKEDQPCFTSSCVDGYALRCEDITQVSPARERTMRILSTILAGDSVAQSLEPGCVVRVMTGARVPEGADAVVMKEDVREADGEIKVFDSISRGTNIRHAGEELRAGAVALEAGTVITPRCIALAASLGYEKIRVYRRPRVAIITTGDELCSVGQELSPGKVRDANAWFLRAAVTEVGSDLGSLSQLVRDDKNLLHTAISSALETANVVITTGGVSVGEADYVKDVFHESGVRKFFWGVDVKPGKPTYFGTREDRLVFGLPGNPVSAGVMFYELVRPALLSMMGHEQKTLIRRNVTLEKGIIHQAGRLELVRGIWNEGRGSVLPLAKRGSHMLSGLAEANCLISVPKHSSNLAKGDEVEVHLLP